MSAVTGDAATSVPPTRQPMMARAAPAATPARLLTTACGLADQIVACGMSSSGDAVRPALIQGRAAEDTTPRGGAGWADIGPDDSALTSSALTSSALTRNVLTSSAHTGRGQSRVNWLGLQPVEGIQWMVLPMGAGLADGYLGVALFLAQLARLTGVGRYAEVARRAVSPLPPLLGVLDGRADLLATVGCGVAEGMAGISYALARVSTLLDDPAVGEWAEDAVRLTARLVAMPPATELPSGVPTGWPPAVPAVGSTAAGSTAARGTAAGATAARGTAAGATAARGTAAGATAARATAIGSTAARGTATEETAAGGAAAGSTDAGGAAANGLAAGWAPQPAGWLDGLAGCLAAMTAVHTELGSATAAAVARACADQLAGLVERTGGRCAATSQLVPPGFAAGPAGVGWALARYGATTSEPAYQEAGRRAVWCAVDPAAVSGDGSPGWCAGTAGLLVARSCLGGTEPQHENGLLTQQPALGDLSLCHGEAGIAEALTMLGPAALAPTGQPSPRQPASGPASPPASLSASAPPPWRHRAGLIVNAVGRHTRFCGTPGGVPTPGLLRGLAGIGYGLLRAGFTERVPSVLFLEPTPADGQRG